MERKWLVMAVGIGVDFMTGRGMLRMNVGRFGDMWRGSEHDYVSKGLCIVRGQNANMRLNRVGTVDPG